MGGLEIDRLGFSRGQRREPGGERGQNGGGGNGGGEVSGSRNGAHAVDAERVDGRKLRDQFLRRDQGDLGAQFSVRNIGPPEASAAGITNGEVSVLRHLEQTRGGAGDQLAAENEGEGLRQGAGGTQTVVRTGAHADGQAVGVDPRRTQFFQRGENFRAASARGGETVRGDELIVLADGEGDEGGRGFQREDFHGVMVMVREVGLTWWMDTWIAWGGSSSG